MGQQKAKMDAGKAKKNKLTLEQSRIVKWVVALVAMFAVLITLGLAVANDWFEGFGPACTVGDVEISKGEFRFNFHSNYSTFVNYYSSYLSAIGLNTNQALSQQKYDEERTWEDYFNEQTFKSLADTVAMSEAAKAKGVVLNEENTAQVDKYVADVRSSAKASKVSFGAYTKNVFGRKLSEEEIRTSLSRILLADQYAEELYHSYDITDAELDEEYAANKAKYDTVLYRAMSVNADIPSQGDTSDEEYEKITLDAMKAAKQEAAGFMSAIKEIGTEDKFAEVALDYAKSLIADDEDADPDQLSPDDSAYAADGQADIADADGASWLYDEARKAGDITLIEETDGYTIYMFVSRQKQDYNVVNVRHILVPFNDDMKEAQSTAEDTAARKEAESLKASFEQTSGNEEAFAALAKEKGTDATKDEGGLMENVTKGQTVEGFDDWIFAAGRKAGDYDIVKTVYGYHLVYFSGYGREAWQITVDEAIRQARYNAEYDSIIVNYPVKVNGIVAYAYTTTTAE